MSDQTLIAWKDTAALLLVERLPLQTLDTAIGLVEDYLTEIGGWIPDDQEQPVGFGQPFNQFTQEEAVAAIVINQYNRIYSVGVTATATLKFTMHENLAAGIDDASVLASLEAKIRNWLTTQIEDKPVDFDVLVSYTGVISHGGVTTTAQRVAIQEAEGAMMVLTDPRAIALRRAREIYSLDITHNVERVYTENDAYVVVIIRKYTTATYSTLDASETQYVLKLDPDRYTVVSGLELT